MWSHWTGQKIVCVNAHFTLFTHGEILPLQDQVYTIRTIRTSVDGLIAFRLAEITNTPHPYQGHADLQECGFLKHRFRPVTETKSDISILTAITRMAKATEPA